MSGDEAPRTLYLLLLLVLVTSSLIGMRLPVAKVAKMALAWVAIFGAAFILFAFSGDFSALGQRLRAEATGAPIMAGGEMRIPMSEDGHFWVDAMVNGQKLRFLVDSGASTTTISTSAAEQVGLSTGMQMAMVETANGAVRMPRGRAEQFKVGDIERADFSININPNDATNVLGMNFLSSLRSWQVERRYLILRG
jgi:aspartyl protease family protein